MRGKRSKAYRKLMTVYANSFGFREPYQVLVDPSIIQDAFKFKMDLAGGLERTLQGKAKPMITQCCIRHLYATDDQPLITLAKTFERRRCNHSIDAPALSSLECLRSVVIPSEEAPIPNKHRYIVATDDQKIREEFRRFPGVPGIHIMRSVMVLDQVSDATLAWRDREESGKLRSGLKDVPSRKRKRDDNEDKAGKDDENDDGSASGEENESVRSEDTPPTTTAAKTAVAVAPKKKKKEYGKKQPNPLSVMKKKKKPPMNGTAKHTGPSIGKIKGNAGVQNTDHGLPKAKRKRKRAHGAGRNEDGAKPTTDTVLEQGET